MFRKLSVNKFDAPWCVDGRPDYNHSKGPQMLGGSIHPIILYSIFKNIKFGDDLIDQTTTSLKESGFKIGVHRGSNKNASENKSDCGFADNLGEIIQTSQKKSELIKSKILSLNIANNLEESLKLISEFNLENINISGENLIAKFESIGDLVIDVEGEHHEVAAYIDFSEGETLDTNEVNKEGEEYFNMDIWEVVEQAKVLGIDEDFAINASLILYLATEMVLVEDKGKAPLPIFLYDPRV